MNVEVPARARYLRALMAELERLANHFGDIGAICNDASFAIMHAHCGILREEVLRAAAACFGHRLMMDCGVPGGVSTDLPSSTGLMTLIDRRCKTSGSGFRAWSSFTTIPPRCRTALSSTGIVRSRTMRNSFGAPGYVGRASGRNFDARKAMPYAPYDGLDFDRSGA